MQAGRNQGLQEVECCARPNHRFQPTSFPPRLRRAGEAAAEPRRWASLVRLHKSITAPLPRHNDNTIGQTMETSIGTGGSRACYRLPRTDPVQSSPSLSKRSMTDPGVSPCVQAWARLGGQTTDTCSCSRTRRQPRSGFRLGDAGGPQQGTQRVEGVGLFAPRRGRGMGVGRARRIADPYGNAGQEVQPPRAAAALEVVEAGITSHPEMRQGPAQPPYRVFRRRGPLGPASRRRWGRRGGGRIVTRPSCSWMRRMTGVAITRSPSAPHLRASAPWRGRPVIGPGPAPPGRPGNSGRYTAKGLKR